MALKNWSYSWKNPSLFLPCMVSALDIYKDSYKIIGCDTKEVKKSVESVMAVTADASDIGTKGGSM